MKKNTFGIRRIMRIMIVACAFAAFAGGQAFAAEWPDGGEKLEDEIGDLLFACVHAARLCGVDSDTALRKATEKFISRFCSMENAILQDGKCFQGLTLSEMDVYWKGSKQRLR